MLKAITEFGTTDNKPLLLRVSHELLNDIKVNQGGEVEMNSIVD